ncbi:uncharacterized protein BT62DRAFT_452397 [Guyanagaster necrorhizus]|uniref:Uncharacterized protein n=1 Tax=Guyanagaster necrorhizus TaxID=856835 RepID=A0A9P8ANN0_9AGAR|nr:uncharacterized protein BT62DRAFT_452397 [Guyanagaster necrorhizus MCA 3950]KAG7442024.1 hypothetical protein BT62DRAFT_452397 [Guyanagaster necrorhizus MCA 3950]
MVVNIIVSDLVLRSVDFVVLTDAQRVLRRKDQPKDEDISTESFCKRLRWALSLMYSPQVWDGCTSPVLLPPMTHHRTCFLLEQSVIHTLWDLVAILVPYHAAISTWSGTALGAGAYRPVGVFHSRNGVWYPDNLRGLGCGGQKSGPWVYGRLRDAYTYR